ncbi:hypothetical protein [uncultured Nostoc sp.]
MFPKPEGIFHQVGLAQRRLSRGESLSMKRSLRYLIVDRGFEITIHEE